MIIWGYISLAYFLASDLAAPNVGACWSPGTAFQILAMMLVDRVLHFFELLYKKDCDPHYICLSLLLILSIPNYFVISNHI